MNVTLTQKEVEALATALRQLVVRDRTGELGIMHGADRFVSTNVCLRKPDREALNQAAAKVGLPGGVSIVKR